MGREPAAVEKHQRIARGDTAEGNGGIVAARGRTGKRRLVARQAGHLGQRGEQVGRLRRGTDVNQVEIEARDRKHLLEIHPLDVRTGDGEGLEFDDIALLGGGGRRRRGGGLRQHRRGDKGDGHEQGAHDRIFLGTWVRVHSFTGLRILIRKTVPWPPRGATSFSEWLMSCPRVGFHPYWSCNSRAVGLPQATKKFPRGRRCDCQCRLPAWAGGSGTTDCCPWWRTALKTGPLLSWRAQRPVLPGFIDRRVRLAGRIHPAAIHAFGVEG